MRLKIPYYAQRSEFSCGPACVLMLCKYFNPRLRLNRALEFEVWRRCNMIGVRCSDPYGVSVPLLEAGYQVELLTERRSMIALDAWEGRLQEQRFTREDVCLSVFGVGENRKRAMGCGLKMRHGRLTVERISKSIEKGFVPIALVHMGVVHQLNFPHWVVVTDIGDDSVAINDPYPPKGGKGIRVCKEAFQSMLDDVGTWIGLSPSVLFVRDGRPTKNARSHREFAP